MASFRNVEEWRRSEHAMDLWLSRTLDTVSRGTVKSIKRAELLKILGLLAEYRERYLAYVEGKLDDGER